MSAVSWFFVIIVSIDYPSTGVSFSLVMAFRGVQDGLILFLVKGISRNNSTGSLVITRVSKVSIVVRGAVIGDRVISVSVSHRDGFSLSLFQQQKEELKGSLPLGGIR